MASCSCWVNLELYLLKRFSSLQMWYPVCHSDASEFHVLEIAIPLLDAVPEISAYWIPNRLNTSQYLHPDITWPDCQFLGCQNQGKSEDWAIPKRKSSGNKKHLNGDVDQKWVFPKLPRLERSGSKWLDGLKRGGSAAAEALPSPG